MPVHTAAGERMLLLLDMRLLSIAGAYQGGKALDAAAALQLWQQGGWCCSIDPLPPGLADVAELMATAEGVSHQGTDWAA